MARTVVIEQQKAIAQMEAAQTISALLGGESERLLYSAQHDAAGRMDAHYVTAMLVSELARVVAAQQERIDTLESALEAVG